MPRATTKLELISMANEQFDKLFDVINSMSEKEQNDDFCYDVKEMTQKDGAAHWERDKNLKDVLVHLYEWHRLLIDWENANSNGIDKPFLPSPYTWKTYGEMNVEFWKKHQGTSLNQAIELLKDSHNKALELIEKYTDEQLFTKKFYKWTGTSSLGQYCISATVSHYDWAIKKIKMQIKALKG